MRQVGLRELRDRASKILREVREQKSEYVIVTGDEDLWHVPGVTAWAP